MKQEIDLTSRVQVLAVSAFESDHIALRHIFGHTAWDLKNASNLCDATAILLEQAAPVVVCDENLPDGSWKDLLPLTGDDSDSCRLIVMSDLADERLWAEVLNLGAYDVLAKPLRSKEVFASVGQAWRHWMSCRKSNVRAQSHARTLAAGAVA